MRQIFLLISIIILICHNLMGQFFYSENQSIYSDIKAHNVGDIITVLIVESANASRESKINSSSGSNVATEGAIKGNLTKFLPIFGA
ncbi:MAG: flagellar basal body L-ring protein FlgH, partial [Candidatus Marinimicrobia bacterium]|nr:flagellar basal body L-ring protein FlgH [Candidatus Neomarinimicrobiota bacterium]